MLFETVERTRTTIEDVLFGPGPIELLREVLPAPVRAAFSVLTHLGDGALLVAVVVLFYWFRHDRRRDGAFVVATGLAGLALTVGLKAAFGRSRPPEDVRAVGEFGHSFPSAHALGATVLWGMLAVLLDVGTKRQRYAIAGVVISIVALSRVVLGVHYLGDVLAGVAIGIVYLWALLRGVAWQPEPVFQLAVGLSVLGLFVTPGEFAPMAVGASIGATAAWYAIRERDAVPSNVAMAALGLVCVPTALAVRAIGTVVPTSPLVEVVGFGMLVGAAIVVPVVAAELDRTGPVRAINARRPTRTRRRESALA